MSQQQQLPSGQGSVGQTTGGGQGVQSEHGQSVGGGMGGQTVPQAGGAGSGATTGTESLVYSTSNYLPEEVRVPVIKQLNKTLADTLLLRTQVEFAHWNVKGMQFIGLHELFEDIAEGLAIQADRVAERITALGGQAMGNVEAILQFARIPPLRTNVVDGAEFVDLLIERLSIHDAYIHEDMEFANEYGDLDTTDLLNDISREVTQDLWFLESHFQTQAKTTVPITQAPGGMQGGAGGGPQGMGGQGTQGVPVTTRPRQ